jgi:CPA2 family monovalent cation:H+ antiporter-2
MHGPLPLIATLAVGLGLALAFGLLAQRLLLPPLVGYLLAGIVIGPHTPGFVGDVALAAELAEIGVMLLMFGVGLHFSWKDLLSVRRVALPGAIVQMAVATACGALLARFWGWGWGSAALFGLALSVASTVVLLRALEARHELTTGNGRLAVGWLVVEDLAMVLALVLLPPLAPMLGAPVKPGTVPADWLMTLVRTLLAVAGFVALMLVVGRKALPWLLWKVTQTGSRELFTLAVIAAAVSLAFGAASLFGVSFALGAFLAGMVLRESKFSHRAAEESLPLRDAFAVLFFVSVGMLFDPGILLAAPFKLLLVVGVVVVAKSLAAALLVLLMGLPLRTALTVATSLAQIGEFSFILATLGGGLGLLDREAQSLIVAAALVSIAVNPAFFATIESVEAWLTKRYGWARRAALRDDPLGALPEQTPREQLERQVVLIGVGRVGRGVLKQLQAAGQAVVVVDSERGRIERLRAAGQAAVWGDASDPTVLVQAHIADAGLLVLALPDTLNAQRIIDSARELNPELQVLMRAPNTEEALLFSHQGGVAAVSAEQALAQSLGSQIKVLLGKP